MSPRNRTSNQTLSEKRSGTILEYKDNLIMNVDYTTNKDNIKLSVKLGITIIDTTIIPVSNITSKVDNFIKNIKVKTGKYPSSVISPDGEDIYHDSSSYADMVELALEPYPQQDYTEDNEISELRNTIDKMR